MPQIEWKTYAEARDPESPTMGAMGFEARIRWPASWGRAFGAVLVPLVPSAPGSQQLVLLSQGSGIRRPQGHDVQVQWQPFNPPPSDAVARTPPIPWPADASHALLTLVFKSSNPRRPSNNIQLMANDDADFGQNPTALAMALVTAPTVEDIQAAVAQYLREFPLDKTSVGVLKR